MFESRKPIMVWAFVLLLGLTVGMAHADEGSNDEMNQDLRNQPVAEELAVDLASDSSATAETANLDPAIEPDCVSDSTLSAALGIKNVLSVNTGTSSWAWTCGPCSISACANLPVGNPCGFNRWCVVTTTCSTQPLTERCVCGTDHF